MMRLASRGNKRARTEDERMTETAMCVANIERNGKRRRLILGLIVLVLLAVFIPLLSR